MIQRIASSFRDPSGFTFAHGESIYRQVNLSGADQFDDFVESGLYNALVEDRILVPHEDVTASDVPRDKDCHRVIKPELIPFVSYPYEWCFSQLKDAAILTLRAQAVALRFGFVLKDASAYNVQFHEGKPVFIDTLSFERLVEGEPWVAYRQFCQHFLAPLALASYVHIDLVKLLLANVDGVPLALASKMLPLRSRLSYGMQVHIHLHARMQAEYADMTGDTRLGKKNPVQSRKVSPKGLRAIVESLATTIQKLKWSPQSTEWGDYYGNTNYSSQSEEHKRALLEEYLTIIAAHGPIEVVQDLGANTGEYSRIASSHCSLVVSQDIDPLAVEKSYNKVKESTERNILPLVQNLVSPSPAIGWANEERESFRERSHCDVLMALALIHHISISNNTPLASTARLFASLGDWLIIEFVPKSDSQVVRLLSTRVDIFPEYTEQGFEDAFLKHFHLEQKSVIAGTDRSLYLLRSLTADTDNSTSADL